MQTNTLRISATIGVMVADDAAFLASDRDEILSRVRELECQLENDFPHLAFFVQEQPGVVYQGIVVTPEEASLLEEAEHNERRAAETDREATSVRY